MYQTEKGNRNKKMIRPKMHLLAFDLSTRLVHDSGRLDLASVGSFQYPKHHGLSTNHHLARDRRDNDCGRLRNYENARSDRTACVEFGG